MAKNFKKFTDCYIYIGNYREYKHGNMKIIFDSIVRRHEYRKTHVNLTCISYIIKDINIKTNTTHPPTGNEYGSKFLFQSTHKTIQMCGRMVHQETILRDIFYHFLDVIPMKHWKYQKD